MCIRDRGKNLAWNGTHIASLDYPNKFFLLETSNEPYGFREEFWGKEKYRFSLYHLFDFLADKIADVLEDFLGIGISKISSLFSLVSNISMGYGNLISVWNGKNFTIFKFNLAKAQVGYYSNFSSNSTNATYGLVLSPQEIYNFTILVRGFLHNSSAVENRFNMTLSLIHI